MKRRILSLITAVSMILPLIVLPQTANANDTSSDGNPEARYSTDGGETWTKDSFYRAIYYVGNAANVKIELLRDIVFTGTGEGYTWESYAQRIGGTEGAATVWTIDGKQSRKRVTLGTTELSQRRRLAPERA